MIRSLPSRLGCRTKYGSATDSRIPPSRTRARSAPTSRGAAVIDAPAIAATARAALDENPSTWTSYAELCSASGLSRGLALVVARALDPEPTINHWFRIRNEAGLYNVPVDEGDPGQFSRAEADRKLAAVGVAVIDGRADRARKLVWTSDGWTLAEPH